MDSLAKTHIRNIVHLENKERFAQTKQGSFRFTTENIPEDFWADEENQRLPTSKIKSKYATLTSGEHDNIHFIDCTTDDAIQISQHQNKNRSSGPEIRTYAVNFANHLYPAMNSFTGGTQEEELFQQYPDLCFSLVNSVDQLYPLHRNEKKSHIVLTENVLRRRGNFDESYPWVDHEQIRATFITAAAPHVPQEINTPENSVFANYETLVQDNLNMIFGCSYGVCNDIIIGAWGCGAFSPCDPETRDDYLREIASEIIHYSFRYSGKYNNIWLPVPADYDLQVYEIFKQTFELYIERLAA